MFRWNGADGKQIGEASKDCERKGTSKSRFYNTFDYFGNKRKVRDWTVIRKLLIGADFLRRGETTDCLKSGWK